MTIAPPPAVRSFGIACLQQRKTLFRFAASTASHASSAQSSTGPSPRLRPLIPAVFTSTSSRSSGANAASGSSWTSMPATRQPSASKAALVAAPIPPALPVTTTVCTRTMLGSRAMEPVVERIRDERLVAILRRVPDPDGVVEALARGRRAGHRAHAGLRRRRGSDRAAAPPRRRIRDRRHRAPAGAGGRGRPGRRGGVRLAGACAREVVERCRSLGVPYVPGALTPTEVERAWSLGAALAEAVPGQRSGAGLRARAGRAAQRRPADRRRAGSTRRTRGRSSTRGQSRSERGRRSRARPTSRRRHGSSWRPCRARASIRPLAGGGGRRFTTGAGR